MFKFDVVTREETGFFPKPPLHMAVVPHVGEQIEVGESLFEVAMVRHFVSANEGETLDRVGILVIDRIVDAKD